MRLTPAMRSALAMLLYGNGISYAVQDDRTMVALRKRELVERRCGGKYGHWRVTASGITEGLRIEEIRERRKKNLVHND
jgi:hypothetical protein